MRVLDSLLRAEPVPAVSPDGRRVAYLRDDGKGASELRLIQVGTLRRIASHEVNGNVTYGWLGDTLVVAQLDYTSRWRVRSDLYRWRPGSGWRRVTRGARLAQPRGGGGRLAALALRPGADVPTVPLRAEPLGARAPDPLPDGTLLYATLTAGGWELRHAAALPEGAPVAFPTPLPFEPAPAVPVRETGYAPWPSLRPHFWVPLFL